MPIVALRHRTTYRYRRGVTFGEHRAMLRPLDASDQRLLLAELHVSPRPDLLDWVDDLSGASVSIIRFGERADTLIVESRARIDHRPVYLGDLDDSARLGADGRIAYPPQQARTLAGSIAPRKDGSADAVAAWARSFAPLSPRARALEVLVEMTCAIREDLGYELRLQGAPQAPDETLARGCGSCRDFAVLLMEAARSLGFAARFVSGYVYSRREAGERVGQGHTHAWVRVLTPGCGWVDFDPTNAIIGNADLIRVAVVSRPELACPLRGAFDGEADDFLDMTVEVDIGPEGRARASEPLTAHA